MFLKLVTLLNFYCEDLSYYEKKFLMSFEEVFEVLLKLFKTFIEAVPVDFEIIDVVHKTKTEDTCFEALTAIKRNGVAIKGQFRTNLFLSTSKLLFIFQIF